MAFRLPNFNLVVNLWRHTTPTSQPPDGTFRANLRGLAKAHTIAPDATGGLILFAELLCPPLMDIRGFISPGGADVIECPAGSGRHYAVIWVDDIAKGFPNEYRLALITQRPPWPAPAP